MKANSATILIKEGTHQQELNNFVVANPICRQAGEEHYKAEQNKTELYAFPKTNIHFFIYCTHKFIPWVAFKRICILYGSCWSPLKVQIESSSTFVSKEIQMASFEWQEFQCG